MRKKAKKRNQEWMAVEEILDRYMNVLHSSTPPLQHTWTDHFTTSGMRGGVDVHKPENDLHTSLASLSHLDSLHAPLSPIPETTHVPSTLHSVSTSSYSPSLYSTTQNVTFPHTVSSTTHNAQCPADTRRRMPNTHHSREVSLPTHVCLTYNTFISKPAVNSLLFVENESR